jgi:hypothetical protein
VMNQKAAEHKKNTDTGMKFQANALKQSRKSRIPGNGVVQKNHGCCRRPESG